MSTYDELLIYAWLAKFIYRLAWRALLQEQLSTSMSPALVY